MVVSPAGSGKTIIAAAAIDRVLKSRPRDHKPRIRWICNTTEQQDQAVAALKAFESIYRLADVEVKCAQSMGDWSDSDLLVVDECHHSTAETWLDQIKTARGALWGFTATPYGESEELNKELDKIFGNTIHTVERSQVKRLVGAQVVMLKAFDPSKSSEIDREIKRLIIERVGQANRMTLSHAKSLAANNIVPIITVEAKLIPYFFEALKNYIPDSLAINEPLTIDEENDLAVEMDKAPIDAIACSLSALKSVTSAAKQSSVKFKPLSSAPVTFDELRRMASWEAIQRIGISGDDARTQAGIEKAIEAMNQGRRGLVLVGTVEHGEKIAKKIGSRSAVCHSKLGKKRRAKVLEDFRQGNLRCIVATSLADEGLDLPMADFLVMISGGRSQRKAEQRTGRVLRAFDGKKMATIYDFLDPHHRTMENQSQRRVETYSRLGYQIEYEN